MFQQNELFRRHALGNFGAAGPRHRPRSGDAAVSRLGDQPQEPSQRELCPRGDGAVLPGRRATTPSRTSSELARCFTGWEIQHGEFKFNQLPARLRQQDGAGQARASSTATTAWRVILEQPAAAEFICGKLVRFFVTDDGACPPSGSRRWPSGFATADLTVAPVLETIFTSRLFYSERGRSAGRSARRSSWASACCGPWTARPTWCSWPSGCASWARCRSIRRT